MAAKNVSPTNRNESLSWRLASPILMNGRMWSRCLIVSTLVWEALKLRSRILHPLTTEPSSFSISTANVIDLIRITFETGVNGCVFRIDTKLGVFRYSYNSNFIFNFIFIFKCIYTIKNFYFSKSYLWMLMNQSTFSFRMSAARKFGAKTAGAQMAVPKFQHPKRTRPIITFANDQN